MPSEPSAEDIEAMRDLFLAGWPQETTRINAICDAAKRERDTANRIWARASEMMAGEALEAISIQATMAYTKAAGLFRSRISGD